MSQTRDMARLTNGFNGAANEKSRYMSSQLRFDAEAVGLHCEDIEERIQAVAEENEQMLSYQEILRGMLARLDEDHLLWKKRLGEAQEEA